MPPSSPLSRFVATVRPGAGPLLVAVLLLSAACGPRETDVARATREGVLRVGIDADIAELDPQLATGVAEFNTLLALFEGLVDLDPRTLAPVPALAEDWSASADGLTWTFRLRPGLHWTDGTALTATDVVASWKRLLAPGLAAGYARLLDPVVNAEAYRLGRLADFGAVGLAAPDARTIRLQLAHPEPRLPERLALPPLFPVPLHAITRSGPADRRGNPWTRQAPLVSNGPFRLREWRAGQAIAVEPNPLFRDATAVRLRGVVFFPVENLEVEERMFRAGQLHVVSALPVTRVETWQRDATEALRRVPLFGTDFLRINVARPPLADPRVRRALALALDRDELVRRALQGTKRPASTLVPPGLTPAPTAERRPDPQAARALLAAAGHPDGQGLPPLTLLFNSSAQHRAVAEVLQEQWRRTLGLEVRLENQENKVVLEARRTGTFQLLRSSWTADYPDAAAFLEILTGASGNNHTGWADPEFDRLLAQAQRHADPASRAESLRLAEERLLEQTPVIPLYHYIGFYLVHPSVRGWETNALDRRPLKALWLAGD